MVEQTSLNQAWGPLRVILEDNYSFNSIKQVVSLAGVDVTSLAHLEQKSGGGGATKGQLMTALDREIAQLDHAEKVSGAEPSCGRDRSPAPLGDRTAGRLS